MGPAKMTFNNSNKLLSGCYGRSIGYAVFVKLTARYLSMSELLILDILSLNFEDNDNHATIVTMLQRSTIII